MERRGDIDVGRFETGNADDAGTLQERGVGADVKIDLALSCAAKRRMRSTLEILPAIGAVRVHDSSLMCSGEVAGGVHLNSADYTGLGGLCPRKTQRSAGD